MYLFLAQNFFFLEMTDELIMPEPSGSGTTSNSSGTEIIPGPSTTESFSSPRQSAITSYFNKTRPLDVNHQKRIDQQLTKMIVKG